MANHKEDALKNDKKVVFHVNEELLTHIDERAKSFDSRSAYLRWLIRMEIGTSQTEATKE